MEKILNIILLILLSVSVVAQESRTLAIGRADAVIDLRTQEGIDLVNAVWRTEDAKIVNTAFHAPGPSDNDPLLLYPTGTTIATNDLTPKAGAITFNDSNWEKLDPNALEACRGNQKSAIYFTDPPYGLPKAYDDETKELNHQGVYRFKDGRLDLLSTDLGGPNGLAFSPDEKYLYVSNWDIRDIHRTKTLWRYEVKPDGTLGKGEIFFDMNQTDNNTQIKQICNRQ
jgi:sugar lactone lactonase YvrE